MMSFNKNISDKELLRILSWFVIGLIIYLAWPKVENYFDGVNSTQEAQEFLIGTWVYDQPLNSENSYFWWERLEVKGDNTVFVQNAMPTDNQWGAPETKKYKVVSEKFRDSGDRYFAMIIDGSTARYIVSEDKLVMQLDRYDAVFRRGDRDLRD